MRKLVNVAVGSFASILVCPRHVRLRCNLGRRLFGFVRKTSAWTRFRRPTARRVGQHPPKPNRKRPYLF
jgi:hypothetical protein